MAVKYTKMFQSKGFQNIPKSGFFVYKPVGNAVGLDIANFSKKLTMIVFPKSWTFGFRDSPVEKNAHRN
jgi:hypothetical protein